MSMTHYKSDSLKQYNGILVGTLLLNEQPDYTSHDYYLLLYMARGNATHKIQAHEHPIYEGDILLISPNTRHTLYGNCYKAAGFYYCCISAKIIEDLCKHLQFEFPELTSFFDGGTPYLHATDNIQKLVRDHFIRMIDDFVHVPAAYTYSISYTLYLILIYIFRTCNSHQKSLGVSYANSHVDLAILYIKRNIHSKISLDELAEDLHISKTYLCKLFKKHLGKTVTQAINQQKIEEVKDQLQNTNRSIELVAQDFGMNTTHLNRVFRAQTGLSMVEYRKKYHFKN